MKPVLVALVALATSVPAAALACSCMEPGGTWQTAPADGDVGVPTNALIWVGGGMTRGLFEGEDQHPIELLDEDGVVLTGGETRLRGNWDLLDVFTPDFLLEPNATYSIRVNDAIHATFTTGAEADNEPPAVPSITEQSTWSRGPYIPDGGMCGNGAASHGISVGWDMGDAFVLVMDANAMADVDTDLIDGTVPSLALHGHTSLGKGFGCGGDNWDGARNGADAAISGGTYDIAGNFSGWSEAETIVVRPDPTEGCSAAGSSRPSLLALAIALLGGVLIRRRGYEA